MASTGPCHSRAAKSLLNTHDIKFLEEFKTARPCVQHTHRARCVPHVQESATSTECILGILIGPAVFAELTGVPNTLTLMMLTRLPVSEPRQGHKPQGQGLGLPDLPFFTGDAVFQPGSPAYRKEAARDTESPVFDYRHSYTDRPNLQAPCLESTPCRAV